jgi:hypothetical protein
MKMPQLDLSKPQEGGGNVNQTDTEEGIYDVTVKSASYGTDDKNREKITIDFETAGGDVFRKWLYLHMAETKRISLDQLSRLGTPKNWSFKNTDFLVGKECRIEVGRDDSKEYASVEKIFQKYIAPGKYRCEIVQIGKKEEAKSGKEFRRVFYLILDDGEFKNLKIMDKMYFNEKSMKFTASKLQAMGASRADFDTDSERHMQELEGGLVEVTLSIRRGNDGRDYPNVKNVKLLDSSEAPPVASASGEVEVPDSQVAGFDEEDDEDDIPF